MLHEDHSKTIHYRVLSGVDRAPPLSVLRKRMLPEYGKWLTSLLTAKPDLKVGLSQEVDLGETTDAAQAPDGLTSSTPILESTRC